MAKMGTKQNIWDVVVIGGGPAGLMSASIAGKYGAKVLLIEKNEIMGKKLLISGGGRCNITNVEPDQKSLLSKFGKKGNFLFTPFSIFDVGGSVRFFESLGVKIKVENNFRAFPVSDKSSDVLEALVKYAKDNGVEFKLDVVVAHFKTNKNKITSIILEDGSPEKILPDGKSKIFRALDKKSNASGKTLTGEEIKAKNFILATGGKSRPETGSTGDGFKWLKEIGHKVVNANPSLVPIKLREQWIDELAGITLENVGISVLVLNKTDEASVWKKVHNKVGRVLFTHTGLSGPTIINMSKIIGDLLEQKKEVKIAIDFFPGVGLDVLNEKMIKLFENNPKKKIKNLLIPEVPEKIYHKILDIIGIDAEWFANEITRAERISIIDKFKMFKLTADSLLGYDKAIISSGGVELTEVDFKEMKSKLYNNLFLVGDILDFDRPSGGYSLQLCWTTGYVAGKSAAENSL
jgi:hypothetical protein